MPLVLRPITVINVPEPMTASPAKKSRVARNLFGPCSREEKIECDDWLRTQLKEIEREVGTL